MNIQPALFDSTTPVKVSVTNAPGRIALSQHTWSHRGYVLRFVSLAPKAGHLLRHHDVKASDGDWCYLTDGETMFHAFVNLTTGAIEYATETTMTECVACASQKDNTLCDRCDFDHRARRNSTPAALAYPRRGEVAPVAAEAVTEETDAELIAGVKAAVESGDMTMWEAPKVTCPGFDRDRHKVSIRSMPADANNRVLSVCEDCRTERDESRSESLADPTPIPNRDAVRDAMLADLVDATEDTTTDEILSALDDEGVHGTVENLGGGTRGITIPLAGESEIIIGNGDHGTPTRDRVLVALYTPDDDMPMIMLDGSYARAGEVVRAVAKALEVAPHAPGDTDPTEGSPEPYGAVSEARTDATDDTEGSAILYPKDGGPEAYAVEHRGRTVAIVETYEEALTLLRNLPIDRGYREPLREAINALLAGGMIPGEPIPESMPAGAIVAADLFPDHLESVDPRDLALAT